MYSYEPNTICKNDDSIIYFRQLIHFRRLHFQIVIFMHYTFFCREYLGSIVVTISFSASKSLESESICEACFRVPMTIGRNLSS